jgi:hypothetical protein
MADILKKLKKNSSEEIWIAVTDYKEHELLDMRVYYRSIDDMEMKPTKRGVSIPLAKAPDLLAALEKIDPAALNEPVGRIDKSDAETVQVALKEFKGHRLVDVRTYFRPQAGGDMIPTQKGVAFKFAMLDEVKEALRKAQTLMK